MFRAFRIYVLSLLFARIACIVDDSQAPSFSFRGSVLWINSTLCPANEAEGEAHAETAADAWFYHRKKVFITKINEMKEVSFDRNKDTSRICAKEREQIHCARCVCNPPAYVVCTPSWEVDGDNDHRPVSYLPDGPSAGTSHAPSPYIREQLKLPEYSSMDCKSPTELCADAKIMVTCELVEKDGTSHLVFQSCSLSITEGTPGSARRILLVVITALILALLIMIAMCIIDPDRRKVIFYPWLGNIL